MSQRARWLTLSGIAVMMVIAAIVIFTRQGKEPPTNGVVQAQAHPTSSPRPTSSPVAEVKPAADPNVPKPICTLTAAQAMDIKGLKLGMNLDQTLAAFPGSREDAEVKSDLARPPQHGVTRFVIRPEKFASKEKFAGIKQLTFSFLDGRMFIMNVGYPPGQWKNVDEFIAKVSEGGNLPAIEAWDAQPGMDTQIKNLKCDGFDINASALGPVNSVRFRDLIAEREVNSRRAKAQKEAEKQAKP